MSRLYRFILVAFSIFLFSPAFATIYSLEEESEQRTQKLTLRARSLLQEYGDNLGYNVLEENDVLEILKKAPFCPDEEWKEFNQKTKIFIHSIRNDNAKRQPGFMGNAALWIPNLYVSFKNIFPHEGKIWEIYYVQGYLQTLCKGLDEIDDLSSIMSFLLMNGEEEKEHAKNAIDKLQSNFNNSDPYSYNPIVKPSFVIDTLFPQEMKKWYNTKRPFILEELSKKLENVNELGNLILNYSHSILFIPLSDVEILFKSYTDNNEDRLKWSFWIP